ncbi:hypothetical protein FQN50_003759 [Emmonsiellopsis sp. PD_5]|nr:hypothetical protein FQN50_003759 [Emmonsiellopsis sp. PD_5]
MDTLSHLLTSTLTLITLSLTTHHHVTNHGRLPLAAPLIKANNNIYALASLLFCITITCSFDILPFHLSSSLQQLSDYVRHHEDQMRYIYHLSKIWEYVDPLLMLANGGRVGWHFAVHHLTTPYLTYIRIILPTSNSNHHHEGWKLLATLNTLHHFFMYAYFGGMARFFRPVLPVTGCLQLVVGIVGEMVLICRAVCSSMGDGDGGGGGTVWLGWPNAVSMLVLGVYFVLFVDEVRGGGAGAAEEKGLGEDGVEEELRNQRNYMRWSW